jgi:hypothetical protein
MMLKRTTVSFSSPCGETLAGILTEPAAAGAESPPRPFSANHCAILCHGFASHKNGFHFPAIAEHLASQLGMVSTESQVASSSINSASQALKVPWAATRKYNPLRLHPINMIPISGCTPSSMHGPACYISSTCRNSKQLHMPALWLMLGGGSTAAYNRMMQHA